MKLTFEHRHKKHLAAECLEHHLYRDDGVLKFLLEDILNGKTQVRFVVAYVESKPIGVIFSRRTSVMIYVHPDFRQQGVATALLSYFLKRSCYKAQELNAVPDTESGMKLFSKMGIKINEYNKFWNALSGTSAEYIEDDDGEW